ncbi:NOP5/NOP56 family protein [Halovenus rubra]|uniref:NOP5/NOP56 family protein n=2 Tax=Halovenus rubra TaxID=869890 RepID=A0ABD5X5Z5_9EURY|nr:NOP5/NOP56 family protein [Halovenus rubra]
MNAQDSGSGWFESLDSGDVGAAVGVIRDGSGTEPREWAQEAIDNGAVPDESTYYNWLHEATLAAAREETTERELADDQQLIHAIRSLDDCERVTNELTERLAEWAGTHDADATVDTDFIRELAAMETDNAVKEQMSRFASRVVALDEETQELREFVERRTPDVAPNLATLAGPELAARLISLAGGIEDLAKKPSGTVQVLGAEESLFAHLGGSAPSPKHGVIYLHEAVRDTPPANRGSAARALAGKLSIAARIDHYSGEYRPSLEAELDDRIERIRARDAE